MKTCLSVTSWSLPPNHSVDPRGPERESPLCYSQHQPPQLRQAHLSEPENKNTHVVTLLLSRIMIGNSVWERFGKLGCISWHLRFPWLAPELRWGKAWVRWDTRSGFWGVLEWRCAARTSGRLWRWLLGRRLTNGGASSCQYPGVVINYFYNPQKSTINQSLGKSISYFRLQLMRT